MEEDLLEIMTNMSVKYNLIMKLLALFLINCCSCQPDVQYLIFTSPEGKEQDSGVFAGQIDFTVNRFDILISRSM